MDTCYLYTSNNNCSLQCILGVAWSVCTVEFLLFYWWNNFQSITHFQSYKTFITEVYDIDFLKCKIFPQKWLNKKYWDHKVRKNL